MTLQYLTYGMVDADLRIAGWEMFSLLANNISFLLEVDGGTV
jgi:hypothetical protein